MTKRAKSPEFTPLSGSMAARPDRLPLKWGDWPSDEEVLIVRGFDGRIFSFVRDFPCGQDDYVLLHEIRGTAHSSDAYMVPSALVYYRDLEPNEVHRQREKKAAAPAPMAVKVPVEGVKTEVPAKRKRGRPPKNRSITA